MPRRLLTLPLAGLLLALAGCSDDSLMISDCVAKDGMQPLCQFHNPEDLVLLPDGKTLLVSQMGLNFQQGDAGSLVFFDTHTEQLTPAFAGSSHENIALDTANNWGTADCPGNPGQTMAPHGIALRKRDDQRWQVAAVSSGCRPQAVWLAKNVTEASNDQCRSQGGAAPWLMWKTVRLGHARPALKIRYSLAG